MGYEFSLTQAFDKDLEELYYDIAIKLCSPLSAERFVDKVMEAVIDACKYPHIFPKYKVHRKIIVGKYVVYFHINDRDKILIMDRIIYSGMDIGRLL